MNYSLNNDMMIVPSAAYGAAYTVAASPYTSAEIHPYDGCYGDQSPSWTEIQFSLDKYKLITEKLKNSFGSDDKDSNLYIDPLEYNVDEIFFVLFKNLGVIDNFINGCNLEKIKTSKKLDHLCEIMKMAFRIPKVRVHDPRYYIFETAFVLLLSMNPVKGGGVTYPTMESFLLKYPHFNYLDSKERSSLKSFANYMNVAFLVMKPEANRTHLIKVIARIVDGRDVQYIAGSGKTPATKRRLEIFYTESGITQKEGQPKKKKIVGSILQKAVDEAELDDDDEDLIDQIKDQLENEGVFEQSLVGLEDIFQKAGSFVTTKETIDRVEGLRTFRTEVVEKSSKNGNFSISTASTFVPHPQMHQILSRSVSVKVSEPSNQPLNINFGVADEDHERLKNGASFNTQSRSRPNEMLRDRVISYNLQSFSPTIFDDDPMVGSKRQRTSFSEDILIKIARPASPAPLMQRSTSNTSTFSDKLLRAYSNQADILVNHLSVGALGENSRMQRSDTGMSAMSDGSVFEQTIEEPLNWLPNIDDTSGGFNYYFDYQI